MPTATSETRTGLTPEEIEIVEATIDAITSSVPIGLTQSQIVSAANRLSKTAWTQPSTVARRVVSLTAEHVKIVAGVSDVHPDAKDRLYRHQHAGTDQLSFRQPSRHQRSRQNARP